MLFFLGDRWLEIGTVIYGAAINQTGLRFNVPVSLPDVHEFFESRRYLDDGSEEWRNWGPRVN